MGFKRTCKREATWANCGCLHDTPDELVRSQWQSRTKSNIFLVYRFLLAAFYTFVVIWSFTNHARKYSIGLYFIYLTNWGIMMCMTCTCLGFALVAAWHFRGPEESKMSKDIETKSNAQMPVAFKVYWGLHNVTLILSILITCLYWAIIFDDEKDTVDALNLLTHASNSVFMTIDLLIVAHPVRLMHVIQPFMCGLIYGIFTLIYFLAGGVDGKGNPFIYEPLDWRKPGQATTLVAIAAISGIIVHCIIFWLYRLRVLCYKRLCTQKEVIASQTNNNKNTDNGLDNPAFVCIQSEQVEAK